MNAVIEGPYRYALWRDVAPLDGAGRMLFIMLNPSTADGEQDDATIRRCGGFARREGMASLAVANLYAYRATDPKGLIEAPDPIGPENDSWIRRLAAEANRTVVAWGGWAGPVEERPASVLAILDEPECFGLTMSGQPRHPLYLAGDRELVPMAVLV